MCNSGQLYMNDDKTNLSMWIAQHLEEREKRLNNNNQFVWHKPSANDLLPSSEINVTPVDLNVPIEFK